MKDQKVTEKHEISAFIGAWGDCSISISIIKQIHVPGSLMKWLCRTKLGQEHSQNPQHEKCALCNTHAETVTKFPT